MPWKETCTMDEREAFVQAWLSREFTMVELCERFGVSRPTGYRLVERFCAEGKDGLVDRSRAPLHHPNAMPASQEAAILHLKRRHPSWGPVTLGDWLRREMPAQRWPAASSIGALLKRRGLVQPRQRRRRVPPDTQPFAEVRAANDSWSADYKGQFLLGDRAPCYPLTISDNHSRYLLCCQGLDGPRGQPTRAAFERAFYEYGLPKAILTDNGTPFASVAIGGLSQLSIWWLKLGILPQRIDAGEPQQNGRHERMHRTLKAATARPPRGNLSAQQRAFNHFRHEYNDERPHRSLGAGRRPADLYHPSPRQYPGRVPEVTYADDFTVRMVKPNGSVRLYGQYIYIAKILAGEPVGFKPLEHDRWEVHFAQLPLGIFDPRHRNSSVIRPK